MSERVLSSVSSTLRPNDHPYMNGAWTPNFKEYEDKNLELLQGQVPSDLDGVYIRNTENPVHEPLGRYHPFDGDAMLHAVRFRRGGHAEYRNRFVQTKGFVAEEAAGRSLWAGLAEDPRKSTEPGLGGNFPGAQGSLKDSSSTDVVVHAGRALSLFYQCGEAYAVDPETLEPLGVETFGGLFPSDGISAHAKVDTRTGELLFFNYSKKAPYMHLGVVSDNRELVRYVPVPLPGPRLPHDMWISERFAVLCDFPMFWDPKLLEKGIHATRFYPELPSRLGVVARQGSEEVRWFEASPTFVLHCINAYEDGDELVLDGYHQADPRCLDEAALPSDVPKKYQPMMKFLTMSAMKPRLWRWRLNLRTGQTKEECLNDRQDLEFGTKNEAFAGRRYRYAYSTVLKPGWFLFTGLVKHDLDTGASEEISFGAERYGSETHFAPREGAETEDDGYLITIVTDMIADRSECVVYNARELSAGPVCRLRLPHRVSSGTHACWAGSDRLCSGVPNSRL